MGMRPVGLAGKLDGEGETGKKVVRHEAAEA